VRLIPAPQVLAALALAAAAGLAAGAAGVPLPWLLGPLVVTAVAAMADLRLAGAPLRLPKSLRDYCVPVIAVTIGATVTPDVATSALRWWPSLLAMALFVVAVQFANYGLLRRLGGYDRPTAFFAASPGGLIDAVLSGESRGGALAVMSTQHFARIAVTVAVVPFLIAAFAEPVGQERAVIAEGIGWPSLTDAIVLIACAVLGALVGKRLRLPAAVMLGPFVLSAALHVGGLTAAETPLPLVHLAQLVVGGVLGLQFAGTGKRQVARGVGFAALGVAVALGVAAALSLALTDVVDAPFAAVFLAFAPGGLAEMGLIAVSLGIEPAFVVVHHLLRIVLTISLAPLLFDRLVARGSDDGLGD